MLTNDEAIKIAADIRKEVDIQSSALGDRRYVGDAVDSLKTVAETIADVYAATQRVPASAKQAFMTACGL